MAAALQNIQFPAEDQRAAARAYLASTALATLDGKIGPAAEHWRYAFQTNQIASVPPFDTGPLIAQREIGLAAIHRQRERLEEMRIEQSIGADTFLQEELDFDEVAIASEDERQMEES